MTRITSILSIILFTIIFNFIIFYNIDNSTKAQINLSERIVYNQSKAQFKNIVNTRIWNSQFNGVYVKSEQLKPNKYMVNDYLYTKDNEKLIKINHAWMTKQISDIANKQQNYKHKITSLKPLNKDNSPNKFEKEALNYFKMNNGEEYYAFDSLLKRFNYMGALKVEPSCLACHYNQDFVVGDILGGISVSIPTLEFKDFYENLIEETRVKKVFIIISSIIFALILIWFINTIFNRQKTIQDISKKNKQLSQTYKLALVGTKDGLWDWDLTTNKVYFSKNWKSMIGYEENELENCLDTWQKLVHPDDIEKASNDILANQKQQTEHYENIHRLKHKDGHWVWILDRGKTVFDANGKAIRMLGFHTDISKQKELELSLNNSKKNLLNAERISKLGHWSLDIKTMRVEVSENIKRIFGVEKDVKIGMKELFQTYVLAQDQEILSEKLTQSVKDKKSFSLEYRFKKNKFDKIRYLSCNVEHEIIDGKVTKAIGVIQDITKLKLIQKELNILRLAIEHAPITFIISDRNGMVEYVNPCFTRTTGYTFDEILSKNPRILRSEFSDQKDYDEMWDTISSGKTWSGTFRNENKKGEEFWELAFISPIFSDNDEIINYLIIKQEITKEVYLKKELQNKEELMIAQSRHAAMGEMISMIAHQWRQPIAIIAMGANNIIADIELEEIDEDTLKESINEIIDQTEYLSQTIDDFKNFFKPNKQKDLTTIKAVFEETFKVMGKMLENNDINLDEEYISGIQIYTYPKELLQVFINIIKNAKEVLVETRKENRKITIKESLKNDFIVVKIKDNAGGIKKEIIDKVFDPYFSTKDELGTGLGLYMSKTIIEKHLNGELSVYNEDDGACFEIKFSLKDT